MIYWNNVLDFTKRRHTLEQFPEILKFLLPLFPGRKAWHYVEVRRNVVVIFLQKTRAGQVDVAVYGTVVKSGWGEVSLELKFWIKGDRKTPISKFDPIENKGKQYIGEIGTRSPL